MKIEDEINQLGHLKLVAETIMQFISMQSTESQFEHTKMGEWALKPDNWIAFKFTYLTKKAIHISLGVYKSTINDEGERLGIAIKNGRFPNWSKISIYDTNEKDRALELIKFVYLNADNQYRNTSGYPKLK